MILNTNHARKWDDASTVASPNRKQQVTVKVRKQGWITRGEKLLYTLIGIGLIMASFYIVSYASTNDTLNREIQSLEEKIEEQQIKNGLLASEKKELSKPERIIKIARENGLKIQDAEIKQAQAIKNN